MSRHEDVCGSGGIVSSPPAALLPGNSPRYSYYMELGGPKCPSGLYGEHKNPLPVPGLDPRFFGHPAEAS
jgi:hypothetical protein